MAEERVQRIAARFAGLLYLVTMATAVIAEYGLLAPLLVPDDARATARNIVLHEAQWRAGVALDVATFAGVVALIVALYVLLRPVHRHLAVLALAWRLVEASIAGAAGAAALMALKAAPFDPQLAQLFIAAHGIRYTVGLIFYSLGSTLFCALLFQSRYVPRLLSGWGMAAGLAVLACSVALILDPAHAAALRMPAFALSGGFEIVLGFWLLVAGADIVSGRRTMMPLEQGGGV